MERQVYDAQRLGRGTWYGYNPFIGGCALLLAWADNNPSLPEDTIPSPVLSRINVEDVLFEGNLLFHMIEVECGPETL